MKKITFTIILILSLLSLFAQETKKGYANSIGVSFEISKDYRWGGAEPVIIAIDPGSAAEKAGLKINDIILEVDGKGTFMRTKDDIETWFKYSIKDSVYLGIRNFSSSFKEMAVKRSYHKENVFDEASLATYFSFYSLEDVQEREFVLPLTTKSNKNAVFTDYRTFNFVTSSSFTPLDKFVERLIEEHLLSKGLKRDRSKPDFIINTYYEYNKNSGYVHSDENLKYEERFDFNIGRMRRLPVYPFLNNSYASSDNVSSSIKFGIQFFANYDGPDGSKVEVWSGEINDLFFYDYSFESYLSIHIPLVLEAFPYPSSVDLAMFRIRQVRYNYTGISFNMLRPNVIAYIEPDSPAYMSGLRRGDVIKKISNIPFESNAKKIRNNYNRFIQETSVYRDSTTLYYDCGHKEGERMLWSVAEYPKVAEIIKSNKYSSSFSYLFNFNRYIDWNMSKELKFDVQRMGETFSVYVTPEVKNSIQIRVL